MYCYTYAIDDKHNNSNVIYNGHIMIVTSQTMDTYTDSDVTYNGHKMIVTSQTMDTYNTLVIALHSINCTSV